MPIIKANAKFMKGFFDNFKSCLFLVLFGGLFLKNPFCVAGGS